MEIEEVLTEEVSTDEQVLLPAEVSGSESDLDVSGSSPAPVEVVDAQEVVQRIVETVQAVMDAQAAQEEAESTPEPSEEPEEDPEPQETETVPLLVQDVGSEEGRELLSSIQTEVQRHPMMTTPFEEYTVTEGLLLLVLLLFFIKWALDSLKGVFG